jgi:hypothetical protein
LCRKLACTNKQKTLLAYGIAQKHTGWIKGQQCPIARYAGVSGDDVPRSTPLSEVSLKMPAHFSNHSRPR